MKRHRVYVLVGVLVALSLPITWWGRQQVSQRRQPAIAAFPTPQQPLPAEAPNTERRELSSADESAIAAVVQQQLDAFQAEDAERAFSFASPGVREKFRTAEQFMAMVRAEYESVYRPQSINFEEIAWIEGQPVQAVTLLGPSGEWMTAYYQMEQQTDDTWRIAGCMLIPLYGETI